MRLGILGDHPQNLAVEGQSLDAGVVDGKAVPVVITSRRP